MNALTGGVGTELTLLIKSGKKLFPWLDFEYTPQCECEKHANRMDQEGIEWCEQNIPLIVGWLKHEAAARGLPFSKLVARRIIWLAINRAKRKRRLHLSQQNGMSGLSETQDEQDERD